jgi:hypothetical protein
MDLQFGDHVETLEWSMLIGEHDPIVEGRLDDHVQISSVISTHD